MQCVSCFFYICLPIAKWARFYLGQSGRYYLVRLNEYFLSVLSALHHDMLSIFSHAILAIFAIVHPIVVYASVPFLINLSECVCEEPMLFVPRRVAVNGKV